MERSSGAIRQRDQYALAAHIFLVCRLHITLSSRILLLF